MRKIPEKNLGVFIKTTREANTPTSRNFEGVLQKKGEPPDFCIQARYVKQDFFTILDNKISIIFSLEKKFVFFFV